MPTWKKSIFINAIKARIQLEDRTAVDIIEDYPKLSENEKQEILKEF
ncbi:hypothetical protein [Clostridium sp. KNHs205]|jgi:hypothetical protein|nr:hypothetical protein [Clostridium sp. KNHs205]